MHFNVSILGVVLMCCFVCMSCGSKTQREAQNEKADMEMTAEREAQKRTADMLDAVNKATQEQRNETNNILKEAGE